MDSFLDSLSQESYSLARSAAQAELSHSQLQEKYYDIELYTRRQLIQSSLGAHISKIQTNSPRCRSENFSNSIPKQKPLSKTMPIVHESKLPKKKKAENTEKIIPLNRPRKTSYLSSTTNSIQVQNQNSENSQFIKTLNIKTNNYRESPKPQISPKQDLKHSQKSQNSSRLIVPPHPFIVSPALGGEGYDYQDQKHFTDIPPVKDERKTGIKSKKSPFFARVFSETANPNVPADSPLRRPKNATVDLDTKVF